MVENQKGSESEYKFSNLKFVNYIHLWTDGRLSREEPFLKLTYSLFA
jgi:hypothetical protein